MVRITKQKTCVLVLLILGITQLNAQFTMTKHTINNGGGKLQGGSFELNGSIGQVDAGDSLSNGTFSLNGGFWHENNDLIFKNEFE